MLKKDLISIGDLSPREMFEIFALAEKFKKKPLMKKNALRNRTLALVFQKPSNRTRISFEVAMVHLGGYVLYLSPYEIDMGVRESVKDVACVVSRYVDGIVARVFSHESVLLLARYSAVPVINGLSDVSHPCQALSDVFTIKEKFGSFRKVRLAYVGDGNNVLSSLLLACGKAGINVSFATPRGYEPPKEIVEEASVAAFERGSSIRSANDPVEAVKAADVVYTDVWVSMGQESERAKRLADFRSFQINETLMSHAKKDALIMHCLPAHRGEEISDVIDGKNSIVYDQAENRMHVEKAILYKLLARN